MKRRDDIERLKIILAAAMEQRAQRSEIDASGAPGWVAFERQTMVDITREILAERGALLDEEGLLHAVSMAENSACGHSDYASKWALGCAAHVAMSEADSGEGANSHA